MLLISLGLAPSNRRQGIIREMGRTDTRKVGASGIQIRLRKIVLCAVDCAERERASDVVTVSPMQARDAEIDLVGI